MNQPAKRNSYVSFTPSDLAASINQTFDHAYGRFLLIGELANLRISKNKWVYFDLKDEFSKISCFCSVYQLPGPLEDGLMLEVLGEARLHPQFGFSVTVSAIKPVGKGSLKRAADLLRARLSAEGLFDEDRKRPLPVLPETVGVITAASSAALADFVKILNERWGGLVVAVADVLVQGLQSPAQLTAAIEYFNRQSAVPEVLVIIRGGGSADDLAAFDDERVVRAIAASRIPTLVAIGHEVDTSLAELAADKRASTPTNAAMLVVPDRRQYEEQLTQTARLLNSYLNASVERGIESIAGARQQLTGYLESSLERFTHQLKLQRRLVATFDPRLPLSRGYALLRQSDGRLLRTVAGVKVSDILHAQLADGTISATVKGVKRS